MSYIIYIWETESETETERKKRGPHGVVVKVANCDIVINEFELSWGSYDHFRTTILGKVRTPLFPTAVGYIVPLLFFYKDGFGIK